MASIAMTIPDIGDFKDVSVIEVLVKVGDHIQPEQSLITVESDKASMEIPASHAGLITALKIKIGDKVNTGDVLALVELDAGSLQPAAAGAGAAGPSVETALPAAVGVALSSAAVEPVAPSAAAPASAGLAESTVTPSSTPAAAPSGEVSAALALPHLPHASPSVRKLARELGIPLNEVTGSGYKGRITHDDVRAFSKSVMAGLSSTQAQQRAGGGAGQGAGAGAGALGNILPWPQVDFAKFGPVERQDLSRIKKISGANLHRNWVMIPHVTSHEDADVTELEALRVQLNQEQEKAGAAGVKITMLAFVIKACAQALQKFPEFNASLDGEQLVLKKYVHIGFAADTPNGLVVPVLKNANEKGILQLSREMAELAGKARAGKLSPAEMTGGCFSISSLGGIGGTYFTPIINAPELAILGLCRSAMRPVWQDGAFVPRLILPLSLSYDHRVIDGAAAARFNAYLAQMLADFRRIAL